MKESIEKAKILRALETIPLPEDLGDGEKELLRSLTEPGMPLWKIFRSMLDYREGLKEAVINADDDDDAQKAAIRKTKAAIVAIDWTITTFEQALN